VVAILGRVRIAVLAVESVEKTAGTPQMVIAVLSEEKDDESPLAVILI